LVRNVKGIDGKGNGKDTATKNRLKLIFKEVIDSYC
jgi:hypothetical protein